MPGPNARNAGDPATISAPVPAAAVAPAVAMIGVKRAVACRAAASRPAPEASCVRTAGQVEDDVVGDDAEQQRHQQRLGLLRDRDPEPHAPGRRRRAG